MDDAEKLDEDEKQPVEVPHTELDPDLLRAVIESFVLREGTDYGEFEFSLEQKVARVVRQLQRDEAFILFDPESSSVDIKRR
jgi:uncharacterized protein YheU (UPF0270 family)